MKTLLIALAASTAFAAAASAQPIRTRVYAYPPGISADEVRDYRYGQVERRQELEREQLRFSHQVERRAIDPDDDED